MPKSPPMPMPPVKGKKAPKNKSKSKAQPKGLSPMLAGLKRKPPMNPSAPAPMLGM